MEQIISSETEMPVHPLMQLVKTYDGLQVRPQWRDLPALENTLEPLQNVYKNVPDLL